MLRAAESVFAHGLQVPYCIYWTIHSSSCTNIILLVGVFILLENKVEVWYFDLGNLFTFQIYRYAPFFQMDMQPHATVY